MLKPLLVLVAVFTGPLVGLASPQSISDDDAPAKRPAINSVASFRENGSRSATAIDFDTEIMPVLTRSGCNVGSCHGAAAGRGGFHLSLLGSDAQADYLAIVKQFEGRRINLARPEKSLVLRKPTLDLDHEGGDALQPEGAEKVRQWIAAGAPRMRSRSLQTLVVEPTNFMIEKVGEQVSLRIVAHFDDDSSEDVTRWTVFVASDPAAIAIDSASHTATVLRRGQHTIIARYLDRVSPIRISLPFSDTSVDHSREPIHNFIDEHVLRSLTDLRLTVAPMADDATYLRRVHLDLIGKLPDREQVLAFLSDTDDSAKRQNCVDQLLASEDFVKYWAYRFSNLLRIVPQPNDQLGAQTYHAWIAQQIRSKTPMNQLAYQLLTAVGDTHQVGPANFTRSTADARAQAELVSQVFMGTRLQCANCHNHPLDRWTQDDYHGLAAVFAKLDRNREVKLVNRGAVTNVRTGEPAVPRIPGVKYLAAEIDGRKEFADWLTSADNPYFAKSFVNRLWRGAFGRGLVDPADDLRDTNPATHPELLDQLAQDFVEHGYDLRHTLRQIVTSGTYGRSGRADGLNQNDDNRFYSRALQRTLEPEVLADALYDATGVPDSYGDAPEGIRAIELVDVLTPSISLDILGRCSRRESCESAMASGALPTKLHQLNGELVNRKVVSKESHLHRMLVANATDVEILDDIYLRALSRHPRPAELEHWINQTGMVSGDQRLELFEDILWSVLNCSEFQFNH